MTRSLLILRNDAVRERAIEFIRKAPENTRVEFKAEKRTTEQSDKMWAMLTDIAKQATHSGRRFSSDAWKVIFLHALGQQVEFIPALDGQSFIPYGQRSSDLSKSEMSDMIELMSSFGAENGIVFHAPKTKALTDGT